MNEIRIDVTFYIHVFDCPGDSLKSQNRILGFVDISIIPTSFEEAFNAVSGKAKAAKRSLSFDIFESVNR